MAQYTYLPIVAVHGVLACDDEGHARSFLKPVPNSGYQIAQTVGPNGPEHAARLALCWNMHDELVAALTRIADIAKDWEICDGRKNIQLEHSDSYKAARAALAKLDGAK